MVSQAKRNNLLKVITLHLLVTVGDILSQFVVTSMIYNYVVLLCSDAFDRDTLR